MLQYFEKLYKNGATSFYEIVAHNLKTEQKMFIVTANPETFTEGSNNKDFDKLLKDNNTTLIPDGIGIVKAANMLNFDCLERITGIDLATKLLELAEENHYKLALLGAKPEIIEALTKVLNEKYPHINIVKTENGYTENKDAFFDDLVKLNPDICLVALGIPNQENLIYKHLAKFKKGVFVGVGGSFDVLSGSKKRAPKIFQKLNLEWLYRIIKEPKRLKRFYNNHVKFIFKIKKLRKSL